MRPRRSLATIGGVVALVGAVAACGGQADQIVAEEGTPASIETGDEVVASQQVSLDDINPWETWAEEIRRLYEATDSEFIRAVLVDGEITVEEVREARHRMLECINEAGFAATSWEDADGNTGLSVGTELFDSQEFQDTAWDCEMMYSGRIPGIFGLWDMIRRNPAKVPIHDAIANCLIRHEVAPPGFTGRQWSEVSAIAWGGVPLITEDSTPEEIEASLTFEQGVYFVPGWGELDPDEVLACELNPAR